MGNTKENTETLSTEAPSTTSDPLHKCFKAEGRLVVVTVPEPRETMKVEPIPITDPPQSSSENNCWKIWKIVADFKVTEDSGQDSRTIVTSFDTPMELVVEYKNEDIDAGALRECITLLYYDKKKKGWVAFAEQELFRGRNGGFGRAYTSEWDDREVGWGGPAI